MHGGGDAGRGAEMTEVPTHVGRPTELDVDGLCRALDGKVRGRPVAVTMFPDEIHPAYGTRKVDACAILRVARDEGVAVHMNATNHECSHGSFITGFDEGTELIASGRLLPVFIPAYTEKAGKAVNSGEFVFPLGTVKGIGAAPLDAVPEGAAIDWIVVVTTPLWAGQIGAARAVEDGVQPSAAAGSSFCTDSFVRPWFDENVILTPGDFGGRMNNKLKPEEMFVIVPARWANNILSILEDAPDVKGLFEATRTEDASYWTHKANREAKAAARTAARESGAGATSSSGGKSAGKGLSEKARKLEVSMDWEDDALEMIAKAPSFVRKFAVGNVEDYAVEQGYDLVTAGVVQEQMDAAGVGSMANIPGVKKLSKIKMPWSRRKGEDDSSKD